MGTRGIVATYTKGRQKVGQGWRGTYIHSSHPSWLLPEILKMGQRRKPVEVVQEYARDQGRDLKSIGPKSDPLFIEWVYILTDKGIDILSHGEVPDIKAGGHTPLYSRKVSHDKTKSYAWFVVAELIPWESDGAVGELVGAAGDNCRNLTTEMVLGTPTNLG